MNNKVLYEVRVKQVQKMLEDNGVDAYIIKTRESSDKMVEYLFGFAIVGEAYIIITPDFCYSITSLIDAQDSEKSGLFDTVVKYSKEGPKVHLLKQLEMVNPKRVAINVSMYNAKADGFTVGSYRDFMRIIEANNYEIVSSELFIDKLN